MSSGQNKRLQFSLNRQIFKLGQVMVALYFVTYGILFMTNPTSQTALGWNFSRKSFIFNQWWQHNFDSEQVQQKIMEDQMVLSAKQVDGSRFQQILGNMTFKIIGLLYFLVGMIMVTAKSKNVTSVAIIFHIFWCVFGDGNYWLVMCDPYDL